MSSRLDRNAPNASRHSEPIVYCFADGTIQSITMQDYLSAHPEHTEQDFAQIKAVSDSLQRMHDANDRKHNRYRIEEDFDFAAAFIASGDIELCDRLIRAEQRSVAWNAAARLLQAGRLTIAQRRRFIAYFLQGRSIAEIARMEKTRRQTISESIHRISRELRRYI